MEVKDNIDFKWVIHMAVISTLQRMESVREKESYIE